MHGKTNVNLDANAHIDRHNFTRNILVYRIES